jgi:hypothetical protein
MGRLGRDRSAAALAGTGSAQQHSQGAGLAVQFREPCENRGRV